LQGRTAEHRDKRSALISIVKGVVEAQPVQECGSVLMNRRVLHLVTECHVLTPDCRLQQRFASDPRGSNWIVGLSKIPKEMLVDTKNVFLAQRFDSRGSATPSRS